ncbi:MAG: hypothetical protein JKY20_07255 [Alphaproteobacteria bacterium]|nr:hypothetical protein [Alphaproteobacteria bacterium]
MCGLAHFFEDEGIATVLIALVREHAEAIRSPRALWVPFELGRPLGAPNEPAFQRQVLGAALDLLDSKAGPVVLEDFPDDAPGPKAEETTSWVCPVSFGAPDDEDVSRAVLMSRELETLAPWYQVSLDERGRTRVGVSPLNIGDAAQFVASFLDGEPSESPVEGQKLGLALKDACADVLAYYAEAATAQPGQKSGSDVDRWFWSDTVAGQVLRDVRLLGLDSADDTVKFVAAKLILPKTQGG